MLSLAKISAVSMQVVGVGMAPVRSGTNWAAGKRALPDAPWSA